MAKSTGHSTIMITRGVHDALREHAKRNGLKIGWVAETAIREYLDKTKREGK